MADWSDKFNKLAENKLAIEGNKEWIFATEESKTKGNLQLNVRLFQHAKVEGGYSGPTKNGLIVPINSKEEIQDLQDAFNIMFENAKKLFE
jgi:hypothetical protein